MPLSDPSAPLSFKEISQLFDAHPREVRHRHVRARERVAHERNELHYALSNMALDPARIVTVQTRLDRARREELEAELVLVLLEDTAFRRELVRLNFLWRQLRLHRPGVTDGHFADVLMGNEEQVADLRACWDTIRETVASKTTTSPTSALAL
ncbi:hypothetical protein HY631_03450 [Candidatus Uhrbacteria bacterium]|nr:hypothetical protein [Candidatus Uhrbacteria bacterium]